MDEEALMALRALLVKLAELESTRACSLARLAKQAARPMSVLLRELTLLEEMGLLRPIHSNIRTIDAARSVRQRRGGWRWDSYSR